MRKYPYAFPKGLRWMIFVRDGGCVLHFLELGHVCKDVWGQEHAWNDLDRLTLEHVKSDLAMGKRAPSDPEHLVTLCGAVNFAVPSKVQRALFRQYLAKVAAKIEHEHVEPVRGCPDCEAIVSKLVTEYVAGWHR